MANEVMLDVNRRESGDAIPEESYDILMYLFTSNVKSASALLHSMTEAIQVQINMYRKKFNIEETRLNELATDHSNTKLVAFYSSTYGMAQEELVTFITTKYLARMTYGGTLPTDIETFTEVAEAVRKDVDIYVNIALSKYKGSRLEEIHQSTARLLSYLERPKSAIDTAVLDAVLNACLSGVSKGEVLKQLTAKLQEVSYSYAMNKKFNALFDPFSKNMFGVMIPRSQFEKIHRYFDDKYTSGETALGSSILKEEEKLEFINTYSEVLAIFGYIDFIQKSCHECPNIQEPLVIRNLINKREDYDSDSKLYSLCKCGEHIESMDLYTRLRITNIAIKDINVNYDFDSREAELMLQGDKAFNDGVVHQNYKVCPKCGNLLVLDLFNYRTLREHVKQFIKNEDKSFKEFQKGSMAFGMISPTEILKIDADENLFENQRLRLMIGAAEDDIEVKSDVYVDNFLEVAEDFLKRLESRSVINDVMQDKNAEDHKLYNRFLLWFLNTNCDLELTPDVLIKMAINYFCGLEVKRFADSSVAFDKSLNEMRLANLKYRKYLAANGTLAEYEALVDDETPFTIEDVFSREEAQVEINIVISAVLHALSIEAERCLIDHDREPKLTKVQSNLIKSMNSLTSSGRAFAYLDSYNTSEIVNHLLDTVLQDKAVSWIHVETGAINEDEIAETLEPVIYSKMRELMEARLKSYIPDIPTCINVLNLDKQGCAHCLDFVIPDSCVQPALIAIGRSKALQSAENHFDFESYLHSVVSGIVEDASYTNKFKGCERAIINFLVDIKDGAPVPVEVLKLTEFMLSDITPVLDNEVLVSMSKTAEILKADIILKRFDKIECISDKEELVRNIIYSTLYNSILYQLQLKALRIAKQQMLHLGYSLLSSLVETEFEKFTFTVLNKYGVNISRPRCFGQQLQKKYEFKDITSYPSKEGTQFSPNIYLTNLPMPAPFGESKRETNEVAEALMFLIRLMNTKVYESYISERAGSLNDLQLGMQEYLGETNIVKFDILFQKVYHMPLSVLNATPESQLSSCRFLDYNPDFEESLFYCSRVLEPKEVPVFEKLLGLRHDTGSRFNNSANESLALKQKIKTLNVEGTLIPYSIFGKFNKQ